MLIIFLEFCKVSAEGTAQTTNPKFSNFNWTGLSFANPLALAVSDYYSSTLKGNERSWQIELASPHHEAVSESRPWGHFERYTLNEPCTVKLVYVQRGKRLSLQYHNNRTEFWKVVKGPVKVRVGDEIRVLQTGETVMIPRKIVHRLIGLESQREAVILEISYGQFDESDIVRLEDDYKRIRHAAMTDG